MRPKPVMAGGWLGGGIGRWRVVEDSVWGRFPRLQREGVMWWVGGDEVKRERGPVR